jgi:cobalamin biosynthetic protein CobC
LRSFGKFFGLPGLRLGFVAGPRAIIDRLTPLLGDWPVSAPAIDVGRMALKDHAWQAETRIRLSESADRLRALLNRHRFNITGGTDLFVLVETPEADALHHCLAQAGIWTRLFDYQPDWIRIGLPGDAAAFARLDSALGGFPDCVGR